MPLPPARSRGVSVAIDAQQTFTPGPQDPRALGFMIDRRRARSHGWRRARRPRSTRCWPPPLFAGAVALAAVLCGTPLWMACRGRPRGRRRRDGLLLFDAAFLGSFGARLIWPAIAIAIAAAAAAIAGAAGGAGTETRLAHRRASSSICVTAIKLAVFLHPAAPIGDGMFHVHRAQAVRAGSTSSRR